MFGKGAGLTTAGPSSPWEPHSRKSTHRKAISFAADIPGRSVLFARSADKENVTCAAVYPRKGKYLTVSEPTTVLLLIDLFPC